MANGGPNTNAAQFCIMLGDRSYLDGDFTVFGEVVEGLDVVMRIARGDVVESVRIARVGAKAQSFHPTTESFRALVKEAEQRIAEHAEKKRLAEQDWIARNYPKAAGPAGLVLTERLTAGQPATNQAASTSGGLLRVRYRGSEVRYVVHVLGRVGPPLEVISFGSGENGVPGFVDPPRMFTWSRVRPRSTPAWTASSLLCSRESVAWLSFPRPWGTAAPGFTRRKPPVTITERLNQVYSRRPAKLDPALHRAQLRSLGKDSW